ncbi:MAG TPA: hypothetical protein VMM58_11220 [Bacteroidota bacterium]|nr:hypothetical protein [Bacteroidota bacterium]
MVEGLRGLVVTGDLSRLPVDLLVLVAATFLISLFSAYMYPKVVV